LPRAIINPARLPRARQLDECALCHGGTAALRTPAFSHVPGQHPVELWSLSQARTGVGGPVRRLSHAGADVDHANLQLPWPSGAGSGAHTLDQGLSAAAIALTCRVLYVSR